MDDYFEIEIEDHSHIDIATWIFNFYAQLLENKNDFVDKLKKNLVKFNDMYKFGIEFPIKNIKKEIELVSDKDKKTESNNKENDIKMSENYIEDKTDKIDSLNKQIEKMDIDDDGFVVVTKKKGKKY